jgi:hypothetical protein
VEGDEETHAKGEGGMSDKETGGPAFPRADSISPDGTFWEAGNGGMTLRDWFAGQALAGIARDTSGDVTFHSLKQSAEEAYFYADAMLAERSK